MYVAKVDINHDGFIIPAGTPIPEEFFTEGDLEKLIEHTRQVHTTDDSGNLIYVSESIVEEQEGEAPRLYKYNGKYMTREDIESEVFGE